MVCCHLSSRSGAHRPSAGLRAAVAFSRFAVHVIIVRIAFLELLVKLHRSCDTVEKSDFLVIEVGKAGEIALQVVR